MTKAGKMTNDQTDRSCSEAPTSQNDGKATEYRLQRRRRREAGERYGLGGGSEVGWGWERRKVWWREEG